MTELSYVATGDELSRGLFAFYEFAVNVGIAYIVLSLNWHLTAIQLGLFSENKNPSGNMLHVL